MRCFVKGIKRVFLLFPHKHIHVDSNRHVLVQTGAIPVFVQLLDSSDEDVQFYCAAALSNLAVHGQLWREREREKEICLLTREQ